VWSNIPVISAIGRLRQDDRELKVSLVYTVDTVSKCKTK
jgi:hypothetical protein